MPKRYRVWPYRQGSRSASSLATALGGRVLKRENSKFTAGGLDVIVNWGDANPPGIVTTGKSNVRTASNKKLFFLKMAESDTTKHLIPPFWTDRQEIPDDAFPVVCRTVLAGHSGDGIVIAGTRDDLVTAPLYTKYMKKKDEYRVHIGNRNGEPIVICVQRKARSTSVSDEAVNWQVRNHSNGFIYVRNEVNPPSSVVEAAKACLLQSGLDFGAVDVIYNTLESKAYVLEINTAPGLEGQTVQDYATFFKGV